MPHNKTHKAKKQTGGSGTSEHGVAAFGGPGQQVAQPGSNVIQVNQPSAAVPLAPVQDGGKRRKTAKKKPMKKDEGYCLKCKKYRKMINVKEVEIKNKRKAMKGECKKCGTTMMKFI